MWITLKQDQFLLHVFYDKFFLACMQNIFEYYRAHHKVAWQSIFYYQMIAIKKKLAFGRYAWVGALSERLLQAQYIRFAWAWFCQPDACALRMVFSTWRDVQSKKEMLWPVPGGTHASWHGARCVYTATTTACNGV